MHIKTVTELHIANMAINTACCCTCLLPKFNFFPIAHSFLFGEVSSTATRDVAIRISVLIYFHVWIKQQTQ